jgi:hypothetical protein
VETVPAVAFFWLAVAVSADDDLDDFRQFRHSKFRTFRHIAAMSTDGFFDDALLYIIAEDAPCFSVDVTVVPDCFLDEEIVLSALGAFFGLEHGFYPGKEALHDSDIGKRMGGCVMTCILALNACGKQNALICQFVSLEIASVMLLHVLPVFPPVPVSLSRVFS